MRRLLTTHSEWHWVSHQFVCYENNNNNKKNTQKINSFDFRGVGNQQVYLFWTPPGHFFLGWMDEHFLGAPSQDRTWLFSTFAYCILDAFLKKRIALPIWKSYVRCWRKGRSLNIEVNVTEFYVIKSWWKIKFNKREIYLQLLSLFVCLFVFFVN